MQKLKILAIFPHPDDSVLFTGGSLCRWGREGHSITAVCCTDGEVGTLRTDQTKADVRRMRSRELLAANRIIGIVHLEMLHYPDGGLMDEKKLRKDLFRCVREYQPDRVISLDPWAPYEIHPDHRAVGRMGAEAAVFAGFPLLYPEQLNDKVRPHFASELWFMGMLGHQPNCYVDIASTIQEKIQAVLQFEATLSIINDLFGLKNHDQGQKNDKRTYQEETDEWIRTRAEQVGKEAGIKAAEAFYVQKCLPGHFDNLGPVSGTERREQDGPPLIC
jgi:LmbE family N-acetylglucosaminyl deacetylase